MENLDKLVLELCKLPQETGWVEFKHNNCDPKMVGEDISALANSAVIADRSYAYMIWGVDDNTHEIIGTKVSLKKEKKGNQELENWLRYLLSKNADFEMPVSIPIFYATGNRGKAFRYSLLSGLAEPLGALLAWLVLTPFMSPTLMGCVLAGVAGIMVFISIDELLPAAREYGEAHVAIYGVVSGMAVMAASLLLLA